MHRTCYIGFSKAKSPLSSLHRISSSLIQMHHSSRLNDHSIQVVLILTQCHGWTHPSIESMLYVYNPHLFNSNLFVCYKFTIQIILWNICIPTSDIWAPATLPSLYWHTNLYTCSSYTVPSVHIQCTCCTHVHTCTHMYTHAHTHVHTAHTCTHMHTHVHTCTHMHTYAHTCTHMHTHMYAHAHTCTHMYTHMHTCTHMYAHVHTCTHMYTDAHTCTHMYTHVHAHTCTHMHTHVHTCTHNVHTCTHMYIHAHTCTHMHTHMHTHVHTCAYTHIPQAHTHVHTQTYTDAHMYTHVRPHTIHVPWSYHYIEQLTSSSLGFGMDFSHQTSSAAEVFILLQQELASLLVQGRLRIRVY